MTSTRRTAVILGLLFLSQTVAFIIAEQLISGVLKLPDYLMASGHATALAAGALLVFVQGVAVVGIGVFAFPLLKRTSEPLALAQVGERVAELGVSLLFLAAPLLVIVLGNGLHDGTVAASTSASLGSLLKAWHDVVIVVLYLLTSVGGTVLAALLYRSRLVPSPIAVLGLVGYPVLLVGCVLDMFGVTDVTRGAGLLAVVPGGFFELILPIWLLVKGFSHPVVTETWSGGIAALLSPAATSATITP